MDSEIRRFTRMAFILITALFGTMTIETEDQHIKLVPTTYLATEIVRPLDANIAPNRTLLILISGLRGGEVAWHSMYARMLDTNSADCALVIAQEDGERLSSLYKRCRYIYEVPEQQDWGTMLDMVATDGMSLSDPDATRNINWRRDWGIAMGGVVVDGKKLRSSGGISFFFRWVAKQMILKYNLTAVYDRLAIGRSDQFYGCNLDISRLDSVGIWIPAGQDWGGTNDRMLIANSSMFLKSISIVDPILRNVEPYDAFSKTKLPYGINPETLLWRRFNEDGLYHLVRRFPSPIFVMGRPNEHSNSNVKRQAQGDERWGVRWKYIDEYGSAYSTCESDSAFPVPDRGNRTLFIVIHIDSGNNNSNKNNNDSDSDNGREKDSDVDAGSRGLSSADGYERAIYPGVDAEFSDPETYKRLLERNQADCAYVSIAKRVEQSQNVVSGEVGIPESVDEDSKLVQLCKYHWEVPYFHDWGTAFLAENPFHGVPLSDDPERQERKLTSFPETDTSPGAFVSHYFEKREMPAWIYTLGGVLIPKTSEEIDGTGQNDSGIEKHSTRLPGVGAVSLFVKWYVRERILNLFLTEKYRTFIAIEHSLLHEWHCALDVDALAGAGRERKIVLPHGHAHVSLTMKEQRKLYRADSISRRREISSPTDVFTAQPSSPSQLSAARNRRYTSSSPSVSVSHTDPTLTAAGTADSSSPAADLIPVPTVRNNIIYSESANRFLLCDHENIIDCLSPLSAVLLRPEQYEQRAMHQARHMRNLHIGHSVEAVHIATVVAAAAVRSGTVGNEGEARRIRRRKERRRLDQAVQDEWMSGRRKDKELMDTDGDMSGELSTATMISPTPHMLMKFWFEDMKLDALVHHLPSEFGSIAASGASADPQTCLSGS